MGQPRQRISLRGGPHDNEVHDVDIALPKALFVGNWEDREFAGFTDEGVPLWNYPTVVYKRTGWDGQADLPLYEYSHTEPAKKLASR